MSDEFTRLCDVDKVPLNGVIQVTVRQMMDELAVYNLGGEFYVTNDTCTHGMVALSGGEIEDGQIFCPLHGGAFDIRTGEATEAPCRIKLKTYEVEIRDGAVFAKLNLG